MNPLEQFLTTIFISPGHDMTVTEFHSRFLEWLPVGQRKWTARETGIELAKHREVFRGNANVLTVSDISFEYRQREQARQEIVDKWKPRVKFVDDEVGFMFRDSDDVWRRMKPSGLRVAFALRNVYAGEIFAIKTAARENPICLHNLLAGCACLQPS
jgi:hypothetical protein